MMVKKLLILSVLVTTFLFPSVTEAGIYKVTVTVDGLACPFCAFGVEKKLKSVPGVTAIDIRMNEGYLVLTGQKGGSIDFARVPDAVSDAGFTARTMQGRAEGRVVAEGRTLWLEIGGAVKRLELTGLSDSERDKLLELAAQSANVAIEGPLKKKDDGWVLGPPTLIEGQ